MDERQLDELLRGYDEVERIQKSTGRHFSELDSSELRMETDGVPRMVSAPFFAGGSVSVYNLREGELCLLGRDAAHRIDELGDEDILIIWGAC